MSNLTTFNFGSNVLRIVELDGNPWFVAADACRVLELVNPSQATHVLGEDEKVHILKSTLTLNEVSFPNRGALLISESGLYKLIMRSDKPQAKPFQDWVTKVVLPAIRKDGGYIAGEEHE